MVMHSYCNTASTNYQSRIPPVSADKSPILQTIGFFAGREENCDNGAKAGRVTGGTPVPQFGCGRRPRLVMLVAKEESLADAHCFDNTVTQYPYRDQF